MDYESPHFYPHLIVTPRDNNAYAIMGAVVDALRGDGVNEGDIELYRREAIAGGYDNMLRASMRWVDLRLSP